MTNNSESIPAQVTTKLVDMSLADIQSLQGGELQRLRELLHHGEMLARRELQRRSEVK